MQARTRAHTQRHIHTQTHRHPYTQVTLQHPNMCLLALNLQHSCLLGLHQPAPSPSLTMVSPHHRPPTSAPCLPASFQPPPCHHTTPSPPHGIASSHHHRFAPSLLTSPSPHMSMLSPHCCPHHPSSLSCTADLSVVIQRPQCTVALPPCAVTLQPPAQPCASSTPLPPTLHHPVQSAPGSGRSNLEENTVSVGSGRQERGRGGSRRHGRSRMAWLAAGQL
jgi:hypothetical protein